jgi:hypothetical protein
MVCVRLELDQAVSRKALNRHMDGLTGQTHSSRYLRHRERVARELNRPKHLPARCGHSLIGGEAIAGLEKEATGAKRREDHLGDSLPDRRPLRCLRHMSVF